MRIESHSFDYKAECKSVHIHEIMHSCYLIALLLVFWFQSVCGNQNAALDKNYSDRLTEPNNQQSSLQPNNEANHATVSSAWNQFIASATDPSHETSHVNALETNIYYEIFMPFFYLHFFCDKCYIFDLKLLNQEIKQSNHFIYFSPFFCIKSPATSFQTRTIPNRVSFILNNIICSWQLTNITRIAGFDEVTATTAAAQKLDQLRIVVLCPRTMTTTMPRNQ